MNQRHACLRSWAQRLSRLSGFAGLLEQVVPEFGLVKRSRIDESGVKTETEEAAVVDVLMSSHLTAADRLVDVTWRSPFALHLVGRAAKQSGAAAAEGVADKRRRYRACDGVCIDAWSCELLGVPSAELLYSLRELSVLAGEVQAERGFRASDWLDAWSGEVSGMAFRLVGVALDRAYAVSHGGDRLLC